MGMQRGSGWRICSVLQCCITSTEKLRTVKDGKPKRSTSTFTQLLTSVLQCCFTSTETMRTGRRLLTRAELGIGVKVEVAVLGSPSLMDGHLHFDTDSELCSCQQASTSPLICVSSVRRKQPCLRQRGSDGLSGTEANDGRLGRSAGREINTQQLGDLCLRRVDDAEREKALASKHGA